MDILLIIILAVAITFIPIIIVLKKRRRWERKKFAFFSSDTKDNLSYLSYEDFINKGWGDYTFPPKMVVLKKKNNCVVFLGDAWYEIRLHNIKKRWNIK